MNIVLAAHSSSRSLLPVGSVHLATALAAEGHAVVHLDPPMSPLHLVRFRDPQIRARLRRGTGDGAGWSRAGQWAVTPVQVLERFPALGDPHLAARVPRLVPELGRRGVLPVELLVVDNPYGVGLARRIAPARSVYRATDVYWKLLGRPGLAEVERRVAADADVLVATSGPVAEHLAELTGGRPVAVIPNGATHATRANPHRGDPRVVYAGSLDERFDADGFRRMVEAHPTVAFDVVGGGPKAAQLPVAPNVTVHGWLAHAELLDLLAAATVGVMPLSSAPGNDGRSPIKVFEYLAAGLAVVATSTTELRRLALPRVRLAADPDELTDLLGLALEDPALTPDELQRTRDDLSWSGRARQLLAAADGDQAVAR